MCRPAERICPGRVWLPDYFKTLHFLLNILGLKISTGGWVQAKSNLRQSPAAGTVQKAATSALIMLSKGPNTGQSSYATYKTDFLLLPPHYGRCVFRHLKFTFRALRFFYNDKPQSDLRFKGTKNSKLLWGKSTEMTFTPQISLSPDCEGTLWSLGAGNESNINPFIKKLKV